MRLLQIALSPQEITTTPSGNIILSVGPSTANYIGHLVAKFLEETANDCPRYEEKVPTSVSSSILREVEEDPR